MSGDPRVRDPPHYNLASDQQGIKSRFFVVWQERGVLICVVE